MQNTLETTTVTSSEETTKSKNGKKTRALPGAQFDLLTLAQSIATKWEANPQLTLLWMTSAEFKKIVTDYNDCLGERIGAGSGRSSLTQNLKDLDVQINKAVEEVKIAILAKFGKEKGKAYFSEFGIVKQSSKYSIPSDRNQRINVLPLLVKAIKTHNLQITGFDTAFFDTLVQNYLAAFQATQTTDSAISTSVGNKNELRKQINAVISAISTLIKVNYPHTYEGELRGWGFQKEKY